MNASKMKNMIVIKDLPSNILEEAYVILKPNVKFKKDELEKGENKERTQDFIIKEAENVLSNYFSNIEDSRKIRNLEAEKIRKKYYKLKKICTGLIAFIGLNILSQIFR